MHLFGWDTQLHAAKRMIRLAFQEKGVIIAGIYFGGHPPRDCDMVPPGLPSQYLHHQRSLARLLGLGCEGGQNELEVSTLVEYDEHSNMLDPEGCRLKWVTERF